MNDQKYQSVWQTKSTFRNINEKNNIEIEEKTSEMEVKKCPGLDSNQHTLTGAAT